MVWIIIITVVDVVVVVVVVVIGTCKERKFIFLDV